MYTAPRIEERAPGQFIGISMEMSLMEDKTGLLWRSFMPRRHEVMHRANTDLVSLQVYPEGYFSEFNPMGVFEKWALVEVDVLNSSAEKGENEDRGGSFSEEEGSWNSSAEKGENEEYGGSFSEEEGSWNSSAAKGENEDHAGWIPDGMEVFELKGGLYAVFVHQGSDPSIFDHIYGEWLPSSDFELDDRPHFEVLDAHYRHSDPEASEEIWIPIRVRF